jgi:hypothetical protein
LGFQVQIVLALVAGCGVVYLYFFAPRIVASGTTPNGVELYVTQRMAEPFAYNTSVHFRMPSGASGSFYYDHEDSRWPDGRIVFDYESKFATVVRENESVILFNWETQACSVKNGKFRKTDLRMGSAWRPPFWNPFSW